MVGLKAKLRNYKDRAKGMRRRDLNREPCVFLHACLLVCLHANFNVCLSIRMSIQTSGLTTA